MEFDKLNEQHLDIEHLERLSRDFFWFGTSKLLGQAFFDALKKEGGQDLFDRLLCACGCEGQASGFFRAAADHVRAHPAIKKILITGGEPRLNLIVFACGTDEVKKQHRHNS